MTLKTEQHQTLIHNGEPCGFYRFDEITRKRILYTCKEATDEDIEDIHQAYEEKVD